MRIILLFIILSSFKLSAQIELPLTELKVKQYGNEYDVDYIITGLDLTYLTTNYSRDSTRFYYNDKLFTGIGEIYNSDQSTFITFQNGKLDGHWRDIMWSNGGLLHEGFFKDGLKEGWWHSGSIDLGPETKDGTEFKERVMTRSEYSKGELIKERYFGRDWLTEIPSIQGYREITYRDGQAEDVHKYINMEIFRGAKTLDGHNTSGPKNGTETYYVSKDSTLTEVLLFKKGYIISKNRFKNDTLLHVDEYVIQDKDYNIKRTNYYGNGNIKSQGLIITEFDAKAGEWLYYNIEGLLHKKEIYEELFQTPITTHYNSDGSVKLNKSH
ncbi:MAG: hypothetical protein P8H59_12970 [Flavobacteriales bacterium]|nr:hypothetical protein [Flavobacteriales bacterium]